MDVVVSVLIVVATCAMMLTRSWRFAAGNISAIYALVGMLLWTEGGHRVTLVYVVSGLTVGAVIYLMVVSRPTGRKASRSSSLAQLKESGDNVPSTFWPPLGWFFMGTTLVFCMVIARGLSSAYPLKGAEPAGEWASFVSYWLLVMGLLIASATRSPLRSGSGLLLLLCGASLSYVLITETIRLASVVGILLTVIPLTLLITYLDTAGRSCNTC